MPEFTSPRMTSTLSRSISLRVFCTPVPTSLAESSTRSWTWRPRMPPFLLISASAYFAPSTSLCASAESTPVSGLTMPIFTGSSPSARTTYGAPITWLAPSATPALRMVRRPTDVSSFDIFDPPRSLSSDLGSDVLTLQFTPYSGAVRSLLQAPAAAGLIMSRRRSAIDGYAVEAGAAPAAQRAYYLRRAPFNGRDSHIVAPGP